ncbi:hypothetical protein F2P81_009731 [Scophthalmus maximus]|uniref:Uncharacterized protein n=1 Tax=Scophthalmus maximus TaxID=52904 RepID=A0A6A4STS9_SCOMX|nr:hypothetical protein F2P81_009731 [Scophthalmus maximus]
MLILVRVRYPCPMIQMKFGTSITAVLEPKVASRTDKPMALTAASRKTREVFALSKLRQHVDVRLKRNGNSVWSSDEETQLDVRRWSRWP